VWSQPPQELATGLRILHLEHDVRAVVRLRPVAQHRRLNVVELKRDMSARNVATQAIDECHCALLTRIENEPTAGTA
jgi:hypothetical protein